MVDLLQLPRVEAYKLTDAELDRLGLRLCLVCESRFLGKHEQAPRRRIRMRRLPQHLAESEVVRALLQQKEPIAVPHFVRILAYWRLHHEWPAGLFVLLLALGGLPVPVRVEFRERELHAHAAGDKQLFYGKESGILQYC